MKNLSQLLLVITIFLIFPTSCKQEGNHKQTPISSANINGKPSLDFLVKNSDVIAIIDIYDAPAEGLTSKFKTTAVASASKIKLLKGYQKNSIKIKATPYYKEKGSMFEIAILQSGTNLEFLKKVANSNNYFQPTTGLSLLGVFEDKVQPIWKNVKGKYKLNGEQLTPIETEISNLMNNPNKN